MKLSKPVYILATVLLISLGCGLFMLVLTNRANSQSPNPALQPRAAVPTAVSSTTPSLQYPKGRELTVNDVDIWPNGRTEWDIDVVEKAFATTDDFKSATAYYRNLLLSSGYKVTIDGPSCPVGVNCEIAVLVADNGKTEIGFTIMGSKAFTGSSSDPWSFLAKDLTSGETLITIGIAPKRVDRVLPTVAPPTPTAKA